MARPVHSFVCEIGRVCSKAELKASEQPSALWVGVKAQKLPDLCLACLQAGGVFDSAFTYPSSISSHWAAVYVFCVPKLSKPVVLFSHAKQFHSVSAQIPAAVWDERKMREISGADFIGLNDLRPIIIHPESAKFVTNPLRGAHAPGRRPSARERSAGHGSEYGFAGTGEEGEFQIPVGPVHAGIIEPGHFRFHVGGEPIHKLEVRLSFLHRGIEDFACGRPMDGVLPLIEQVSADESVANGVAYAQAVESLASIEVPRKAESLRLILLELERIYSHLADLGGMAMDVGYYASSSRFATLRENMMRLNGRVGGSRFLRGLVVVGGMARDMPEDSLRQIRTSLRLFSDSLAKTEDLTLSSSTFIDRAFSTGRVSPEVARRLSLVGPVARASGVPCDARKHFAYGAYRSNAVRESLGQGGDVFSRFMVKLGEVKESVRLIEHQLAQDIDGPVLSERRDLSKLPSGRMALGWTEAPRGSCMFLVRSANKGALGRLAIRTASWRNWIGIQEAVRGNITADFPLINKSFNLSYAGADL